MKISKEFFVNTFKMSDINFYLASDLHIDQWNPNLINLYPSGQVKYAPLDWRHIEENSILILAGDVSDVASLSVNYLNEISKYFKYILYVDGNHEHTYACPNLYSQQELDFKRTILNNHKLVYLPKQDFVYKNTVFIGYCGWWDYSEKEEHNYFENWRPILNNKLDEQKFIDNVKARSVQEFKQLTAKLNTYDKREDIKNIVIVTHTVPKAQFTRDISTDHNTALGKITNKKIKYWFFGHNHYQFNEKINDINFISNPRGRPEDYDRVEYRALKLNLDF